LLWLYLTKIHKILQIGFDYDLFFMASWAAGILHVLSRLSTTLLTLPFRFRIFKVNRFCLIHACLCLYESFPMLLVSCTFLLLNWTHLVIFFFWIFYLFFSSFPFVLLLASIHGLWLVGYRKSWLARKQGRFLKEINYVKTIQVPKKGGCWVVLTLGFRPDLGQEK
jgi:hypothetical protein